MDDAVQRYLERKQKRIEARAVEQYRQRRESRMKQRFDDGEEDRNNGGNNGGNRGGNGGGGHGNTRIPFGLCQREGIKVDPSWSPKDAWDALKGKGYSAQETYAELKKTGKVPGKKSAKAKKPPTKIEERHFPDAMVSKTYRKNTMEMAKFVNEHCDDGNITEFLSMATGKNAKLPGVVTCHRSTGGEGCAVTSTLDARTRVPQKTDIYVPLLSSYKDEHEKEEAVRSFVHEWTHFLDISARGKDAYGHFSGSRKELMDAINTFDESKISDEAKKAFDEFNGIGDEMRKSFEGTFRKDARMAAAEGMFGEDHNKWPHWINPETGLVQDIYHADWSLYKKYKSAVRKNEKQLFYAYKRKHRAIMDGVSALQGIYDSLSGGQLRKKDVVRYGHAVSYYDKEPENKAIEALADYVALKATRPEILGIFERNFPDIAGALEGTVTEITRSLRG